MPHSAPVAPPPVENETRTLVVCGALFVGLLLAFALAGESASLPYALVGICGAIFANATGAGGGVIFIPVFNALEFSEARAVATSFGIQCFGMTAGSVAWLLFRRRSRAGWPQWQPFAACVAVTALCSIVAIMLVNLVGIAAPASLRALFSLFSIVLGATLLYLVVFQRQPGHSVVLLPADWLALILVGLLGGMVTAWLSVGVGEFLALYLLIRRFDAAMAVAAAVCVSALSVWTAIPHHLAVEEVELAVVMIAGPSAVLGGFLARVLVGYLSARKLKLFFSTWVLLSGLLTAPFWG